MMNDFLPISTSGFWVDSHCHLNHKKMPDVHEVLNGMRDAGVGYCVCIGTNRQTSATASALAHKYAPVFAAVAVDPLAPPEEAFSYAELAEYAAMPKVIAVGETGLDYHWHPPREKWQMERFAMHLQSALELGLPVIIHTRKAAEDTLAVMREAGTQKAVIHSFAENRAFAEKALDMGFYLSFSGICTYKNAPEVQEAAKYCPPDRLLLETDSPYLHPEPKRRRLNTPAKVADVGTFVARLRGVTPETVRTQSTENFFTLFSKAAANVFACHNQSEKDYCQ